MEVNCDLQNKIAFWWLQKSVAQKKYNMEWFALFLPKFIESYMLDLASLFQNIIERKIKLNFCKKLNFLTFRKANWSSLIADLTYVHAALHFRLYISKKITSDRLLYIKPIQKNYLTL